MKSPSDPGDAEPDPETPPSAPLQRDGRNDSRSCEEPNVDCNLPGQSDKAPDWVVGPPPSLPEPVRRAKVPEAERSYFYRHGYPTGTFSRFESYRRRVTG